MDKKGIFTWLLRFVPVNILNKLQNLPWWVYVIIVGLIEILTGLYNYYTGKGLFTEASIVDYVKIGIISIFGAKAFPQVAAAAKDEFSPN